MHRTRLFRSFAAVGVFIVLALGVARDAAAVVLYATATRNTAPPGSLTNNGSNWTPGGQDDPRRLLNSGWQWQGRYASFLGTPIAPQYFHRVRVTSASGARSERVNDGTSYGHQLAAFARAVRKGEPFPTTADAAVKNMAVIDAIYRAAGLEPRRPVTA